MERIAPFAFACIASTNRRLLALVRAESQLQVAEFSRDFDAKKTLQQEVERLHCRSARVADGIT